MFMIDPMINLNVILKHVGCFISLKIELAWMEAEINDVNSDK